MTDNTDTWNRLAAEFPFAEIDRANAFARFIRMVAISDVTGECWMWTGNRPGGRYGHFSTGQKTVASHRWLYSLIHGSIPDDLVIRHKCDNEGCVNPEHLEIGTSAQNRADMFHRGRGPDRRGEKHPLARLTAEQVGEIRRLKSMGHTNKSLATTYGVSPGHIGRIYRRDGWTNI